MSSAPQKKLPKPGRHTCCTRPPPPRWERWLRMLKVGGGGYTLLWIFSLPFFLTVRDFFCPFKQIRRRWPICASRIRGTLCLKMVHHFMGIESHVWICGTCRSGAPHDFWRSAKQRRENAKTLLISQTTGTEKLTVGYTRLCSSQSVMRCDGIKRKNILVPGTIVFL